MTTMDQMEVKDEKFLSPSAEKNREHILAVLKKIIPQMRGDVLEISSGSGMHAVYLAPALINGHRQWITSEPDEPCHASIRAWIKDEQVGDTVTGPLKLDVSRKQWWTLCTSKNSIEVVVNINMIHIAPFSCCEGLFEGAAHLLSPGGIVFLYGPFFRKGQEATIGNINFDKSLRAKNELWGVRVLEDVAIVARKHQFLLKEVIDMPSNNLSVLFAKV